jgi:hypothetical protein
MSRRVLSAARHPVLSRRPARRILSATSSGGSRERRSVAVLAGGVWHRGRRPARRILSASSSGGSRERRMDPRG